MVFIYRILARQQNSSHCPCSLKSEGIFFMFLGIEEKKLPNFLPFSPKNRLFQANFLPKGAEKGKKLPKKLPICARALEFFRCPFCFPNFATKKPTWPRGK